jgi:hypothetical protein
MYCGAPCYPPYSAHNSPGPLMGRQYSPRLCRTCHPFSYRLSDLDQRLTIFNIYTDALSIVEKASRICAAPAILREAVAAVMGPYLYVLITHRRYSA